MVKMLEGIQRMQIRDDSGTKVATVRTNADGASTGVLSLSTQNFNHLYNGSTFDMQRGNIEGNLLGAIGRTNTTASANQVNHNSRGVMMTIDVIVPHATEQITLGLKSTVNGIIIWEHASYAIPVNTVGKFSLVVYPGVVEYSGTATRVKSVSNVVPRTWLATVIHSGSSSQTYSVNYTLLV